MVNTEELAESVPEDNRNSGETNVKLDSGIVSRAKQEIGVSRNSELAPYIEALVLESMGDDEVAEEKVEEFRGQFEE